MMKDSQQNSMKQRFDFIGMGPAELARSRTQDKAMEKAMDRTLTDFYASVRQTADLQRHFPTDESIRSPRKLQHDHWRRIMTAEFDEGNEKAITRIGDVHAAIGLEPRWYIGGHGNVLHKEIEEMVSGRTALTKGARRELAADLSVIVRAALLDIELSTSAYLNRLDEARRKVEDQQRQNFEAIAAGLSRLAVGDHTVRVDARLNEGTKFSETRRLSA